MERARSTIVPSLVPETSDLQLNRLLHPAGFFRHPDDVLADAALSIDEKRAILSSWASDACAVESIPALRQAPGTERPVPYDDIIEALCYLDRAGSSAPVGSQWNHAGTHRLDA